MSLPKPLLETIRLLAVLGAMTFQMACLGYRPASSFAAKDLDAVAKSFQPIQSKSVIYIYREKTGANECRWFDVQLDKRWVAKPPTGSYFRLEMQPGTHKISTYGDYDSVLEMNVEPGKIYFIAINWKQLEKAAGFKGIFFHGQSAPRLMAVPETDGRAGVLRCSLVDAKVK